MKHVTVFVLMSATGLLLIMCAGDVTLHGRLHHPGEGLTVKNESVQSWDRFGITQPGTGLTWIRCPMGFDTTSRYKKTEDGERSETPVLFCSDRNTSEFWFPERKWADKQFWIPADPLTLKVAHPSQMEWEVASYICPVGYRLPTRAELIELLGGCDANVTTGQTGYCNPCADSPVCAEMFGEDNLSYWSVSTTPCEDKAPDVFGVRKCLWVFNFGDGRVEIFKNKRTNNKFVRCVK